MPFLVGSRCGDCGTRAFPARTVCPRCARPRPEPSPLGSRGRLYSWTTVHVSSSRPTPYDIGYVDLSDPEGVGVRVLAPLLAHPGGGWQVDQPVELAQDPDSPAGWAFADSRRTGTVR
ncbi:OB-fold domain-containing protein [Nocardioides sp. GBK3QG-3]|uniref:OB-fold domain-containing protein n=1 Tax=Nocardioides mangrovi TaxID=2874580 RepID=A0ABS7UEW3_9ACTN|nr:OB-fold domain-containing protein [Nocardioides mangrovi]